MSPNATRSTASEPQGPLISIVVLNHNKADALRRNLTALREVDYPHREVIVVDNASADGSAAMVASEFPGVHLVTSGRNLGAAGGRNLGADHARGEYLIFLDEDVIAPPDICSQTARLFDRNPWVGALAFNIRHMPEEVYCFPARQGRPVASFFEAAFAYRRELYERVGRLDEQLFFGAEGVDSTLRLLEAGYRTRYTPEVLVDHYPVAGLPAGDVARRKANWIAGWGWFFCKHFPLRYVCLFLARLVVTYLPRSFQRGHLTLLPRACSLFLRGLPAVWRRRKVASVATVAFYARRDVEPPHFNTSPFENLWQRLRGKRTGQATTPVTAGIPWVRRQRNDA